MIETARTGGRPGRVRLALARRRLRAQLRERPRGVLVGQVGVQRAPARRPGRASASALAVGLRALGEDQDRQRRVGELVVEALALEWHERAQVDDRRDRPARGDERQDRAR